MVGDLPYHQLDEGWRQRYADQVSTPEMAISRLRPGQRLFVGGGAACPWRLLEVLVQKAEYLADMELVQIFAVPQAQAWWQKLDKSFRILRLVETDAAGRCVPSSLYDVARAVENGKLVLDAALVQVTPPDSQGWCSLGCQVALEKIVVANAGLVIAEVNPALPWTEGDSLVNINDIDYLVEARNLSYFTEAEHTEYADENLGRQFASLVENGSVMAPDSHPLCRWLLRFLKDKKHLNFHTEVISEEIMDLMELGVVKESRPGRPAVVTSAALGSERFYRYLHKNANFSFQKISLVCQPTILERLERLVAINVIEQIDLTGQAAIGPARGDGRSWLGGRLDFHRAARRSRHGKSILVIPSLSRPDNQSRIVYRLDTALPVVYSREDTQYVVTEYGVAYLEGKDLQERALSLISIAHPNWRDELLRHAVAGGLVRPEFLRLEGSLQQLPLGLRSLFLLDDGTVVTFRPVLPTDESLIKRLFYDLSQHSIYNRWMANLKQLPEAELRSHVMIDYRSQVALVGTLPSAEGEEIVAVGGFVLVPNCNRAEVALVVRDDWQRRGLGTFLLRQLIQIARRNGIAGFTAEVLTQNIAMQHIFNHKSGCRVTCRRQNGTLHFELEFD